MNKEIYEKIADLMLFGINLAPGDKLLISLDYPCREGALVLAERAYARGALWVDLAYDEPRLGAQRIGHVKGDFWFPEYLHRRYEETSTGGWKHIALISEADAQVYEGLPPSRGADYFRHLGKVKQPRLKALMSNAIPWVLTYFPSEAMASRAFPNLSAGEAVMKYWEAIVSIMRLDREDPVSFWKEKLSEDERRAETLTRLEIDTLHFQGPGTDLTVAVNPRARWVGGFEQDGSGSRFVCNLPTDEIFTSPDWRRAEGRVALTRPFVMHQNIGEVPLNAWFEFKDGKVTAYGAERGKESLDAFFAMDERACYLGELALVDPRSPFAAPGITFYNGLYDENAACHLALGKAYPSTLREKGDYSDQELLDLGMNTGNVHEDMMIGGSDVDVTARLRDGKTLDLIKDGEFLF
jgi:aminopeptidase